MFASPEEKLRSLSCLCYGSLEVLTGEEWLLYQMKGNVLQLATRYSILLY
jgi:hypothetical protein